MKIGSGCLASCSPGITVLSKSAYNIAIVLTFSEESPKDYSTCVATVFFNVARLRYDHATLFQWVGLRHGSCLSTHSTQTTIPQHVGSKLHLNLFQQDAHDHVVPQGNNPLTPSPPIAGITSSLSCSLGDVMADGCADQPNLPPRRWK